MGSIADEANPRNIREMCCSVEAAILLVFGQRLDEVIETEPKTPTVMIKGDRKDQCDGKQHRQHALILSAEYEQAKEAKNQDYELGDDDICENCAYKEPVFTFVKREANRAMMADVKRPLDDR